MDRSQARGNRGAADRQAKQSPPDDQQAPTSNEGPEHRVRIAVLGGFDLWVGDEPAEIPLSSERVLAYVALCSRAAVPRALIAGTLWPDAPNGCAHANLRSALSRLRDIGKQALDIGATEVRLARDAGVDLQHARSLAQGILDPERTEDRGPAIATIEALAADLLPGWYDDWAQLEGQRWRQLRLHALETLAEKLTAAGRYAEAVAAARTAVHADPLRESSWICLVRAHLAEGNPSEALHDFRDYAQRLVAELGIHPTRRLCALVADL
ncbi:SARP family transcriptional regulator [Streptomyces sp. NBC_01142]|uniref:AfsR/SARP family transcriptional regulator n=1 Tax=Streptomyces sp. NBC_01142 TaxID=2975865 RepID=UPI00224D3271|nr:BTAD domain-containing putative transcriptional regulator [Streptomyces sp. NBC_01142]MCX4825264.1 SARP family transcriptional regulator [Streptomyces sp. NBC_01142]